MTTENAQSPEIAAVLVRVANADGADVGHIARQLISHAVALVEMRADATARACFVEHMKALVALLDHEKGEHSSVLQ